MTKTTTLLDRLHIRPVNLGASSAGTAWSGNGDPLVSINPATGEPIASVQMASDSDYDRVVDAAATSFRTWRERFGGEPCARPTRDRDRTRPRDCRGGPDRCSGG